MEFKNPPKEQPQDWTNNLLTNLSDLTDAQGPGPAPLRPPSPTAPPDRLACRVPCPYAMQSLTPTVQRLKHSSQGRTHEEDDCISRYLLLFAAPFRQRPENKLLEIPEVSRDKIICFALYTVQDGVMKMTAQLYPLKEGEARVVRLEVRSDGSWRQIAESPIVERGWTAHFRVEKWDATKDVEYRLTAWRGRRVRRHHPQGPGG